MGIGQKERRAKVKEIRTNFSACEFMDASKKESVVVSCVITMEYYCIYCIGGYLLTNSHPKQ